MNDPRADEAVAKDQPAASPDFQPAVDAVEAQPPPPPPPASSGKSHGVVLGLFALLVAFGAAGGVAFIGWQVAEQRQAAADQQAEATRSIAAIRDLVAGTQERVAAQEERISAFGSESEQRRSKLDALDAEMRQARARLEALAKQDAGPERSPSIAEIEFLLLLAGRELSLADNPRVALAALREADQRVARLEDPALGEVRAAINDEIAAVEAVADYDPDGLALRLASLARRVEGLPLRASLTPELRQDAAAGGDATGWDRVRARLRGVAAGLFRIRRSDAPAAPLLAPDESFFLYRNVELDLKSARLAALARDPDNYAASLESAGRALRDYFETSDDAVKSLIAAIEELGKREVAPKWPEIRRSVELLRAAEAAG